MFKNMTQLQRNAIFLAIHLGPLRLLVPQEDVRTVESATDIRTPTSKPGAFGSIRIGRERWPVYCLSETLSEFCTEAGSRRICPILVSQDGSYGLLCDDVQLVTAHELDVKPLPSAMQRHGAAVGGLALYGDELVCVSSADALLGALRVLIDAVTADKAVA
jgi:chemotaxis signal transduction protein